MKTKKLTEKKNGMKYLTTKQHGFSCTLKKKTIIIISSTSANIHASFQNMHEYINMNAV